MNVYSQEVEIIHDFVTNAQGIRIPITIYKCNSPGTSLADPIFAVPGTTAVMWTFQKLKRAACNSKSRYAFSMNTTGHGSGEMMAVDPEDARRGVTDGQLTSTGHRKYGMHTIGQDDLSAAVPYISEKYLKGGKVQLVGHSLGARTIVVWGGGIEKLPNGEFRANPELARLRNQYVSAYIPMGMWDPAYAPKRMKAAAIAALPLLEKEELWGLRLVSEQSATEIVRSNRPLTKSELIMREFLGQLGAQLFPKSIADFRGMRGVAVIEFGEKGAGTRLHPDIIKDFIEMFAYADESSEVLHEALKVLAQQGKPIMFISSTGDGVTPGAHAQHLADVITSENPNTTAKVVLLKGRGHLNLYIDDDLIEPLARVLEEFARDPEGFDIHKAFEGIELVDPASEPLRARSQTAMARLIKCYLRMKRRGK